MDSALAGYSGGKGLIPAAGKRNHKSQLFFPLGRWDKIEPEVAIAFPSSEKNDNSLPYNLLDKSPSN